jgi:hypothetical protein
MLQAYGNDAPPGHAIAALHVEPSLDTLKVAGAGPLLFAIVNVTAVEFAYVAFALICTVPSGPPLPETGFVTVTVHPAAEFEADEPPLSTTEVTTVYVPAAA